MPTLTTKLLLDEYETIIAELGPNATDDDIIAMLVRNAEWTTEGAETILMLAKEYGTAILRNALALAHSMGIEDGNSGM